MKWLTKPERDMTKVDWAVTIVVAVVLLIGVGYVRNEWETRRIDSRIEKHNTLLNSSVAKSKSVVVESVGTQCMPLVLPCSTVLEQSIRVDTMISGRVMYTITVYAEAPKTLTVQP